MSDMGVCCGADLVEKWRNSLREHPHGTVQQVVVLGKALTDAKRETGEGYASLFLGGGLPFTFRAAQEFIRIAKHPVLSDPNQWEYLPDRWTTLRELAALPQPTLLRALRLGLVSKNSGRKDVQCVPRQGFSEPVQVPDSLTMRVARSAILKLKEIPAGDPERKAAFTAVKEWIHGAEEHRPKTAGGGDGLLD